MPNDVEAEKAIQGLNGGQVEGRAIMVTVAKPKEERQGSYKVGKPNTRW